VKSITARTAAVVFVVLLICMLAGILGVKYAMGTLNASFQLDSTAVRRLEIMITACFAAFVLCGTLAVVLALRKNTTPLQDLLQHAYRLTQGLLNTPLKWKGPGKCGI